MKKLTLLLSIIVVLTSCNTSPQTADTVQESPAVDIAKKVYESFNRHDWQGMAALYADSAEFKDPSLGQEIVWQTRKQIEEKYAEMGAMFPDIRDDVTAIYPAGEKNVVVEFVSTGTAPDSSKFSLPICTIFTIENGLITKDYTYYDNSGQ